MKAVVTGASSGIGRDMAHTLCDMGFTVYGVARREDRLKKIKEIWFLNQIFPCFFRWLFTSVHVNVYSLVFK